MVVTYIPQSQVFALAKERLQLATSNHDSLFQLELEFMLNQMYSPAVYNDYEKVVEVCDGSFEAPKGAKRLWGIVLCKKNPNNTFIDYPNAFFVNFGIIRNYIPIYNAQALGDVVVEQNGFYTFTNPQNDDELFVKVWYEGFGTDDKGRIMIPTHYQDFLADGICYRFLMSRPLYYNNDPNLTDRQMQKFEKSYFRKRRQVNGEDQVTEFKEKKSLQRFASSKIRMNSPYWSTYNYTY